MKTINFSRSKSRLCEECYSTVEQQHKSHLIIILSTDGWLTTRESVRFSLYTNIYDYLRSLI
jgi:hypothetical protein